MIDHVVVDVEIKKQIGQNGLGWDDTDKLGVACAVVYEYVTDRFRVYGDTPEELDQLRSRLTQADRVSGFNIWKFDFPVIWNLPGRLRAEHLKDKTNDLLRRIWQGLGHDPDIFKKETHGNWGLDVVVRGTLKAPGKIANGAQAPIWYQHGEYGKLINYCVDDVTLERDLTDFVDRYGYVVKWKHRSGGEIMSTTCFWMTAKRDGKCAECEGPIESGERMVWEPQPRKGYCGACGTDVAGQDPAAEDEDF